MIDGKKTLPDACGIGIFHRDFGSVNSDTCGNGWLILFFANFWIWAGENDVQLPIFGIARAFIYPVSSPSIGQVYSNQLDTPGIVADFPLFSANQLLLLITK